MKIYFCDVCNESIPLKDINANRISIEDGKIICPKCAPKKARKREPLPAGLLAIFVVLLAGLIAVAFIGSNTATSLDEQVTRLASGFGDLERSSKADGARLDRLEQTGRELRADLDGLRETALQRLDGIEKGLADLDKRDGESTRRIEKAVEGGLRGLRQLLEPSITSLTKELGQLTNQVTALTVTQEGYEKQIALVKDLVTSGRPGGGADTGRPEPEAGGSGASPDAGGRSLEEKEIDERIAELSSPNAGVRYSATVELGRYRGPKVVAALERMVADPEDYIRKTAIRFLWKLESKSSIPLFIDALQDEDYYVRKAAQGALRKLTGQNFDYDPNGGPAERDNKTKLWRRWWDANKAKVLGT